jgi:small subunit ribosomal protein S12
MSTFTQNLKVAAKRKKDNRRTPILEKCPHAKGWVNRVTIITPRKPNSAKRPIVKVFLRKMGRLTAHIPGIGHTLKKYGKVLVRGRGPRDLPGVRYSCVRGVLDFIGLKKKKRRRSIYGAEQNDLTKVRARRKYRFAIRRAERDRVQKENEQTIIDSHATAIQSILDVEKKKNKFTDYSP